jgi:hypothetical protein
MKDFLVNRDETGREIVFFPETGKKYYVEWIEPRNVNKTNWGDINPATGKVEGDYGSKSKGAIKEEESLITKENGFDNIQTGYGSPYCKIEKMHNEYKKSMMG